MSLGVGWQAGQVSTGTQTEQPEWRGIQRYLIPLNQDIQPLPKSIISLQN